MPILQAKPPPKKLVDFVAYLFNHSSRYGTVPYGTVPARYGNILYRYRTGTVRYDTVQVRYRTRYRNVTVSVPVMYGNGTGKVRYKGKLGKIVWYSNYPVREVCLNRVSRHWVSNYMYE